MLSLFATSFGSPIKTDWFDYCFVTFSFTESTQNKVSKAGELSCCDQHSCTKAESTLPIAHWYSVPRFPFYNLPSLEVPQLHFQFSWIVECQSSSATEDLWDRHMRQARRRQEPLWLTDDSGILTDCRKTYIQEGSVNPLVAPPGAELSQGVGGTSSRGGSPEGQSLRAESISLFTWRA